MIGASPFACRDERRGGLLCQLYLVSPCWNFCMRPSYLPSAMSWTSWSARLSSLALRLAFLRPCGSKSTTLSGCRAAASLVEEPAQGACQPDEPVCHLLQGGTCQFGKHLHVVLGGV